MAQPWVVHLYAGKGKGLDPTLREIEDGKVLVEIDIEKSKAFDMKKVQGPTVLFCEHVPGGW